MGVSAGKAPLPPPLHVCKWDSPITTHLQWPWDPTVHQCGGGTESKQVGFQLLRTLPSEVSGMYVLTKDCAGRQETLGQDLRPSLRAS